MDWAAGGEAAEAAAAVTGADGRRVGSVLAAVLSLALAPSAAHAAPSDVDVRAARQLFADAEKDELYKQIGQLKVELDFLKKRAGLID